MILWIILMIVALCLYTFRMIRYRRDKLLKKDKEPKINAIFITCHCGARISAFTANNPYLYQTCHKCGAVVSFIKLTATTRTQMEMAIYKIKEVPGVDYRISGFLDFWIGKQETEGK